MEGILRWTAVTAVAPIAWGANYVVVQAFLPADTPLYGAALRALPAGVILLAIARRRPHGAWWWRSGVLGLLNVGAFFALVYLAAHLLPSSIAATVMATSPLALLLAGWVLLGRRPALLPVGGGVLGAAGVAAMLLDGEADIDVRGVAAAVAAMLLSSVGFVLAVRWSAVAGEPRVPILSSTAWQLIAGGLLLLPFAAIREGVPPAPDATVVVAVLYTTLVATALAYVAWFTGMNRLGPGPTGLLGLLNPVTGVLLGILLAGERLGARPLGGMALVLLGVLVGQPAVAGALGRLGPSTARRLHFS